jgi:hypothetical protein
MGLSIVYTARPRQVDFLESESLGTRLRFETSLFVASYDSQGHGGGIRPRLHTGLFYTPLRFCSFKLASFIDAARAYRKRVTCQNPWCGPQKTQPLFLKRLCWGSHVIATQPVHWRASSCLATVPYCFQELKRESVYRAVV